MWIVLCTRRRETLATVASLAHVRKYNTEIVVGFGHMFHALLLLLLRLRLLMLLRHRMVRILGHLQSRMILLHGVADRDVRTTSVLVALIVDDALRIRHVQLRLRRCPVVAQITGVVVVAVQHTLRGQARVRHARRMGILEIFFQLEGLLLIVLGAHTGIDVTENRVLLAGGRVRLVLLMMRHLVSVRHCAGATFGGSTDPYGLLSTAGALDRIVIALDGRLHRIVRRALGRLRAAVMLQRLIVRRGDWWIKRARDGADVVETGA